MNDRLSLYLLALYLMLFFILLTFLLILLIPGGKEALSTVFDSIPIFNINLF